MSKLIFVITLTLGPRPFATPSIRSHLGSVYTIENPMRYPVRVVLDCGYDWELGAVRISARDTQVVNIQIPDIAEPVCVVEDWYRVK